MTWDGDRCPEEHDNQGSVKAIRSNCEKNVVVIRKPNYNNSFTYLTANGIK